jgi:hypothetical protein
LEWAGLPAATPVLAALRTLGATEALRPDIVLLNPRRELVLRRNGSEVVLSLDEVRIEGKPYCRRYVELELERGSHATLQELVLAVEGRFRLRQARRGKVRAARRWLALHDQPDQPRQPGQPG